MFTSQISLIDQLSLNEHDKQILRSLLGDCDQPLTHRGPINITVDLPKGAEGPAVSIGVPDNWPHTPPNVPDEGDCGFGGDTVEDSPFGGPKCNEFPVPPIPRPGGGTALCVTGDSCFHGDSYTEGDIYIGGNIRLNGIIFYPFPAGGGGGDNWTYFCFDQDHAAGETGADVSFPSYEDVGIDLPPGSDCESTDPVNPGRNPLNDFPDGAGVIQDPFGKFPGEQGSCGIAFYDSCSGTWQIHDVFDCPPSGLLNEGGGGGAGGGNSVAVLDAVGG